MTEYNMDTNDVAAMLRYHPHYVRVLARDGKIPYIRQGRENRYNREEVLVAMQPTVAVQRDEQQNGRTVNDTNIDGV